jgi:VanZ family protein
VGVSEGHEQGSGNERLRETRQSPEVALGTVLRNEPLITNSLQGRITRLTALLGAGLGLIGLVLLAQLPPKPKFVAVLNDAAHAPVFGALALVIRSLLRDSVPQRWRTVVAFSVTILLGTGVEWLQGMIGRDASWNDVRTDALGAACALGAAAWWHTRHAPDTRSRTVRRAGATVAVLAGIIATLPISETSLAYARRIAAFPIIVQSASPLDLYFIEVRDAQLERDRLPSPWAGDVAIPSLLVRASGGEFPGVSHTEPQPDWHGYSRLRADLTNPANEPLRLTLRVHDAEHNQDFSDRYNRTFEIPARSRQVISVPLVQIEEGPDRRKLDLEHVAGLILFTSGADARVGREFYVTRLWLE